MSTIFEKARAKLAGKEQKHNSSRAPPTYPTIQRTEYISKPVSIPDSFLKPLEDPSIIKVEEINFRESPLPEYRNLYAVVLDNVLTQEECDQLIYMAEQSVGAHSDDSGGEVVEDNGWKPALVNAGRNYEILAKEYRNSERIIWDEKTIVSRLFERVLQGEGIRDYLGNLNGERYLPIGVRKGEKWVACGMNERMRFLRYGPGQFFREHCDGTYETEDGTQRSFYTIHLYLNDSAQAFGLQKSEKPEMLRGGATTFHSTDRKQRLDVDPKVGRVLIFQHRRLLHSGDEVQSGTKFTMRSDLMYRMADEHEDWEVVFA